MLSSSSDSEDEKSFALTVNPKYAKKYEKVQKYKDLQRAKELEEELLGDEDSESESEDEDAVALSTGLDLQILNTIKSIRKGDPRIFDKNTAWYTEQDSEESDAGEDEKAAATSSKKKTYKDVVREQILEKSSNEVESDDEDTTGRNRFTSKRSLAYDQEQQELRKSFLRSADEAGVSDEEDILQVKEKTEAEKAEDELLLKGALDEIVNPASEDVPSSEKFLYDYMLHKKWNQPKSQSRIDGGNDYDIVDEDEEEEDIVDKFESKYNFRFEELNDGSYTNTDGGISVVGHARDVAGSVRRVDDRRKKAREARKEKKEKERRQKEAELRRLKNLKRQELQERLNKILAVSGLDHIEEQRDQLVLNEEELDEEWDPVKHEEQMRKQFGDDYYNAHEDDERFLEDVQSGRIVYDEDEEPVGTGQEPLEGNVIDYDEEYLDEEETSRKQKSLKTKKEKDLLESLYKLDYEDIVGGIPCRFKYKSVDREDFGLDAVDIVAADDAELNKFVGLKKLAPYRKRSSADDASKWSKKRKRLRESIQERLARLEEEVTPATKKSKASKDTSVESEKEIRNSKTPDEGKKKRKRKKKRQGDEEPKLINKFTVANSVEIASSTSRHAKATQKTEVGNNSKKQHKAPKPTKEVDRNQKRLDLYK